MGLNLIIAVILMGITGYFDGLAFGKAPHIWNFSGAERIVEIVKTLSYFLIGLVTYIASTYFLHQQGIENALIVTLVWFVVTMLSLVFISGSFASLATIDKVIAIAAILMVGALYVRGVGE